MQVTTSESFPMGLEALKDSMFRGRRERDFLSINLNSIGCHGHSYRVGHLLGGEHLELGFLRAQLDLVLGAEDLGELEKVEQFVDVIADQSCIVGLPNTGNDEISKHYSQA